MLLEDKDEEGRELLYEELYDDGKADETALEQLRQHMGWKEEDGA